MDKKILNQLKGEMVDTSKRLFERGLIAGIEGNLSVRLKHERLLITPTGINKGMLKIEDLLIIDQYGQVIEGRGKPSIEATMHIVIYQHCPEVNAIVHAHPPFTVALTLVGFRLDYPYLPETMSLSPIGMAQYSTPGTSEVPQSLMPFLPKSRTIILERHGAVTLGRDLNDAFDLMDGLEHVAQICWAARVISPIKPLSLQQLNKLKTIWDKGSQ